MLVVDETRHSGGVGEAVLAGLVERGYTGVAARVAALDSFVPLGDAATLVLVSEDDIAIAAESLDPDSSAGLLVYENVWATRFRDAIVDSGGRLVDRGHIPPEALEAALEAAQAGE